jgi:ribonuclease HII
MAPTLKLERELWATGLRHVAGIDEAGRGALAGPVIAAAVVVPPGSLLQGVWASVRDSKTLSARQREALEPEIKRQALAWAVCEVGCGEVDELGIAFATRRAMVGALTALAIHTDALIIDWVRLPMINLPQHVLTKADATVVSVAAASILAKVARDRGMVVVSDAYPDYGFDQHKGYGTPGHFAAIGRLGPCPLHRRTFAPFAEAATLFDPPPLESDLDDG